MQRAYSADELRPQLPRAERVLVQAAIAALAVSIVGWFGDPRQFYQSYLTGYTLVLGATLGCLGLAMVHQLTGGAWGDVTRPVTSAACRALPVLTLLFLPIVPGMSHLYEWTHAEVVAADAVLREKSRYLNVPFFLLRAALYFAVWNVTARLLDTLRRRHDRAPNPADAWRLLALGGGGLVAYVTTVTFAAFDWLMSLDPHWASAIFGVLVMGGQGLTALAVLIVVLYWMSSRAPDGSVAARSDFHDLGNLLLAFVMLWAYFAFSQYLIISAGNLAEEVTWYTKRLHTSWRAVGQLLVFGHFAVPFALLLSRTLKRDGRALAVTAGLVLIMRVLDHHWLVAPQFHPAGIALRWLDLVLPFGLSALWAGMVLHYLRSETFEPSAAHATSEVGGRAPSRA